MQHLHQQLPHLTDICSQSTARHGVQLHDDVNTLAAQPGLSSPMWQQTWLGRRAGPGMVMNANMQDAAGQAHGIAVLMQNSECRKPYTLQTTSTSTE